jgi:transposase
MTVITMSRNELTRLRVLIDIADGRLSIADATGLIGVGRRQIYRLLQAFRADGADGLISRKRGGPSNRALGLVFRETVLAIVRERYSDFGPTLAAEKLSELHGLDLGVETLRQWMIGAGLWVRRKDRLKRINSALGAIAWVSWCRSMAQSTGGSRTAVRNAPCWSTSTTPPAA